jgi:hypothetical protein
MGDGSDRKSHLIDNEETSEGSVEKGQARQKDRDFAVRGHEVNATGTLQDRKEKDGRETRPQLAAAPNKATPFRRREVTKRRVAAEESSGLA